MERRGLTQRGIRFNYQVRAITQAHIYNPTLMSVLSFFRASTKTHLLLYSQSLRESVIDVMNSPVELEYE